MKYLISYFAIVSFAVAATGDVQIKQKTASGAFRDVTIPVTNSTLLGFDSSGNIGKVSDIPLLGVETLNITGNALPLPPGTITMWSTADIANKPTNALVCDGTYGTPTITLSDADATAIIVRNATLAAPSVTPASGTYSSEQTVIVTADAGATIYYTTNATNPTHESSVYSTPLTASTTTEYRFAQVKNPGLLSPITTRNYTINVVTSLFTESFEGTGAPANWVAPGGSGTVNWDNATALVGTQSMSLYNNATATVPAVATGEIWVRFAWRLETTGIQRMFFRLLDGSAAIILRVGITSTGYITVQNLAQTTVATATTGAMPAANTWYYTWVRYVPGTGANAIIQVFGSTTATRPNTPDVSVTNWTGTATVGSVQFNSASSATIYFDDARAQTTTLD